MVENLVIVGYGPSAFGKKLGNIIDSMDVVVKLHDNHILSTVDFGERYDVGILPGPWLTKALEQIQNTPDKEWLVYMFSSQRSKVGCPSAINNRQVHMYKEKIDNIFQEMFDIGRAPTRGLCAVAMCIWKYQPKNIWLVGFDDVMSGELHQYHDDYPLQKYNEKELADGECSRHNFKLEKQTLEQLSNIYNTNIRDISDYAA
jgi:hypothetical protein